MKKYITIFTAVCVGITAIFGFFGFSLIHKIYDNEINTVQNLAGAVITEYPKAEQIFMEALNDESRADSYKGSQILSSYGYDAENTFHDNTLYKMDLTVFILILLMFLVLYLICGYFFFAFVFKQRKQQEKQTILLLDKALSGDYAFIKDVYQLDRLQNPLFADVLKKLFENLRLKTEILNTERDHTKTLVTDLSHQIKTPLSAFEACFSMYLEADNDAERSEFLSRCKIQLDKLKSLTDSLINISRLENDMITITISPIALSEMIVGAVNTVYHKALKKNIEIITADFEDITLKLDKKWTIEAIANILDNAVKYSPDNSRIEIRVQKMYSFARIEIEDAGIGISRTEQNQIFKRFYRGNSEIVQNEDGSGVGLYLSRKILEEQGGTVSVYPAKEHGSIFVIQLPL